MKELLESFFNAGGEYSTDGMFDSTKSPTFEQWYEQNQVNIDNAIELYLNLQGKSIVDTNRLDMLEDSFINRPG